MQYLTTFSQYETRELEAELREDIPHLYRMVHRYVKLNHQQLMERFGQETLARASLFVAL